MSITGVHSNEFVIIKQQIPLCDNIFINSILFWHVNNITSVYRMQHMQNMQCDTLLKS